MEGQKDNPGDDHYHLPKDTAYPGESWANWVRRMMRERKAPGQKKAYEMVARTEGEKAAKEIFGNKEDLTD